MSRRANRIRAQIAATVSPIAPAGDMFVCQTRDVSQVGCFLDTATPLDLGSRLAIVVFDKGRGSPVEVTGEVTRVLGGVHPGLGIRLLELSDDWEMLIAQLGRDAGGHEKRGRRLRVLVVGEERRQRGALALYVTSGWDVRFATDLDGTVEALRGVNLDAVIAEHDSNDERWPPVMDEARKIQPGARRIVRGVRNGPLPEAPLVHRFVDRDAGLDALLDALTAERL